MNSSIGRSLRSLTAAAALLATAYAIAASPDFAAQKRLPAVSQIAGAAPVLGALGGAGSWLTGIGPVPDWLQSDLAFGSRRVAALDASPSMRPTRAVLPAPARAIAPSREVPAVPPRAAAESPAASFSMSPALAFVLASIGLMVSIARRRWSDA